MGVDKALEIPATEEAPSGNGTVRVRASAFDAYRVCDLVFNVKIYFS